MKFFTYLGVYAACVMIYKTFEYFEEPADIFIKKTVKKKFDEKFGKCKCEKEQNESVNLSNDEVGETINRIGF